MTSIRRRTASLVILSMFGLLAFGGAALFVVIRGAMTAQFDDALIAKAAALRAETRFDGGSTWINTPSEAAPQLGKRTEAGPDSGMGGVGAYFVAWVREEDGWRVLEHSQSLEDPDRWPGAAVRDLEPGAYNVELPTDADGRAVLVEYTPALDTDDEEEGADKDKDAAPEASDPENPDAEKPEPENPEPLPPPTVRLAVAASRAGLDRSLALIAWCIGGVCVAFAIASVVATRWAVTLGLSPLTDLSQRVQTLGPDTLDTRLDSTRLPAELRPIADGLNALLARLDEAFQREQRFTAAASHELRTPIAELRVLLEVAASQPRTGDQWAKTADTALGVLARAQSLSETLLRLSRAGSAHAPAPGNTVADVAAIIAEQAQRSGAAHHAGPDLIRIESPASLGAPLAAPLAARIDPAALASIVGNLIDNALRHGEPTPTNPVAIRAAQQSDRVHITVTNPASQLTAADVPRLFEPFWQREASRTDRHGFGLGLAVARTLAHAAGGDLSATLHAGSLTVRVDVPVADAPGAFR